jgi:ADP-heptose:LPS heptosyltransferase
VQVPFNAAFHMVDNFCAVATGDVAPPPSASERPLQALAPSADAARTLGDKLAAAGLLLGEPFVVLNPNAGELALERRWSVERFAELADKLLARFGGKVVLVGAPAERAYVAGMLAKIQARERVIDLAGATSLPELVALFAEARLLVSNDTGPLHLACAVGTPTVSIFGPESPLLFGPRGPQHRVISRGLACSPCLNIYNGRTVTCRFATTRCVAEIGVEQVLETALGQLAVDARPSGAVR